MFYVVSTNLKTQSRHLEKSGRTYAFDGGIVDEFFGYQRKANAINGAKRLKEENDAWCERFGKIAEKDRCVYEVIER